MIVHILDAASGGLQGPTRIMYRANLSWLVCEKTLASLVSRGFVRVEQAGSRRRYEITQSGREVLNSFIKVAEALGG